MDALAVNRVARAAVQQAREGGGPTLIEAKTYRFYDHQGVKGLRIPYRSEDEVESWRARDPITALESRATEAGVATAEEFAATWDRTRAAVDEAVRFAESSPIPIRPTCSTTSTPGEGPMTTRKLSYVKAFNEAVAQTMRADEDVFVAGEDVAGYGGVFHMFDGLRDEFGTRRVIDTPISEAAIIGLGVGAAARGLRPVCDLMFMDFLGVCMDQVVNQAAKLKYMFGGTVSVPLTITTAAGAGLGAAAQHSQSLEAWLAHVPGLKVAMPASAYDAKGLMAAAIRDDNPTIVVLNKLLLGSKDEVPEELYTVPFGQARIVRPGRDVTVVAVGRMVVEALSAAETLARDGIEIEVIDPRTVQPLDTATLVESARRTNRILVVHEAVTFGGIGAEIAAQIQDEAFDHLDAPVLRVGAPFAPVPFSPVLERAYVPDADRVIAGCRRLLERS